MLRVKWAQVISDLERLGVSLPSQAISADVSIGTIYYWRNGGEPKYRNGYLLLDLYMRKVGNEPPLQSTLVST